MAWVAEYVLEMKRREAICSEPRSDSLRQAAPSAPVSDVSRPRLSPTVGAGVRRTIVTLILGVGVIGLTFGPRDSAPPQGKWRTVER